MTARILPDLSQLSREQLEAMLIAASEQKTSRLTLKVSAKGAVSLYGMGQWPVTLYASQWQRLFEHKEMIEQFMLANKAQLAVKPPKA